MVENQLLPKKASQERAGFGAFLKELRRRRKKPLSDGRLRRVTQADIASEVGVSPAYIGFLEIGQRSLPQDAAQRAALARAYGVEPEEFEHFASLFRQGKDQRLKRGPRKKVADGTSRHPAQLSKSPMEQLDWACRTAIEDFQPTSRNLTALPLSTAAKIELVHLYEIKTETKLMAPTTEAALAHLMRPHTEASADTEESNNGSDPVYLDALLVRQLSQLLREHNGSDPIPQSDVVAAWLQSIMLALDSVDAWKPNLPTAFSKTLT